MDEWESVWMGEGKETATLWNISSAAHIVAGSGAIMDRGMMQSQVLGGQWGGLQQGWPHCGAFTLLLFRGS